MIEEGRVECIKKKKKGKKPTEMSQISLTCFPIPFSLETLKNTGLKSEGGGVRTMMCSNPYHINSMVNSPSGQFSHNYYVPRRRRSSPLSTSLMVPLGKTVPVFVLIMNETLKSNQIKTELLQSSSVNDNVDPGKGKAVVEQSLTY